MATTWRTVHGTGQSILFVTEERHTYQSTGATTYGATSVLEAGADLNADPKTKDANLALCSWGAGDDAKYSTAKITGITGDTQFDVDEWDGDGQPTNGKAFESHIARYVGSDGTVFTGTTVTETGASFTTNLDIKIGVYVHAIWTAVDATLHATKKFMYQSRARITAVTSNTVLTMADGWEGDGQPPDGIRFWLIDISVILPIPQNAGLTEAYEPERLVHKLGSKKLVKKNYGYRARFALDYSDYVAGDTLLDLRTALNEFEHTTLVFQPRSDNSRNFNVFFTEEEIVLGLLPHEQGHKGLVLHFESEELTDGVVSKLTGWCIDYATWTRD